MSQVVGRLDVPVLVGVGAAFDFLSGAKPQAPRWIQRSGLEWMFRFFSEPGRLWKRYIKYPRFVALALMQRFGWREFPI
jgi:N-acetylglucosaminyldiphosphoundecaprenol N-acetyl-beta-D-mannosaminyltransferase